MDGWMRWTYAMFDGWMSGFHGLMDSMNRWMSWMDGFDAWRGRGRGGLGLGPGGYSTKLPDAPLCVKTILGVLRTFLDVDAW